MDTSLTSFEFLTPQWSHIPSASWTWCGHPQLYRGPLIHGWHRLDIICTALPTGHAGPEGEGHSEPCFPWRLPFLGLNAVHTVLFASYAPLPACEAGVGRRKPRWPAWRSVLPDERGCGFSPTPGLVGTWHPLGHHRLCQGSYLCDHLPFPHSLWVTCFLCISVTKVINREDLGLWWVTCHLHSLLFWVLPFCNSLRWHIRF